MSGRSHESETAPPEPEAGTLTISSAGASRGQHQLAGDAIAAQRQRLLALIRSLDGSEWSAPTRCPDWSVQDVVRHLGDVATEWLQVLSGGTLVEGFDPRMTPSAWLAASPHQPASDTVDRYERANAALSAEVAGLSARQSIGTAVMPYYGEVPWSVVALHAFWDAWVHERDVVLPLGRRHVSTACEARAAALFGLFMAAVPSKLLGRPLDETLVLAGEGGGKFHLVVDDDIVSVEVSEGTKAGDALRGRLPEVVDALIGRGALEDVLEGPVERILPLGSLARFNAT